MRSAAVCLSMAFAAASLALAPNARAQSWMAVENGTGSAWPGNAMAAAVIALPLSTLAASATVGARPAGVWSCAKALAIAAGVGSFGFAASLHMCGEGEPWRVTAVTTACLAVAMLLLPPDRRSSRPLQVGCAVAAVVLPFLWSALVHEPGYTGNPDYSRQWAEQRMTDVRDDVVRRLFAAKDTDATDYPAGWLRDHPVVRHLGDGRTALDEETRRVDAGTFWHTRLTGLYGKVSTPTALWYPGGRIADAAGRLEWRPAPGGHAPEP